MRRTSVICAAVMIAVVGAGAEPRGRDAGTVSAQAGSASTDTYVGTWTGTWDGAGTGGFVLILTKTDDGKLGGRVSVTGEPAYEATLKTVSFEANKMTATYDFPPDPQIGVVLTATFEDNSASGTWAARQGGSGTDVASGTWTVKRK